MCGENKKQNEKQTKNKQTNKHTDHQSSEYPEYPFKDNTNNSCSINNKKNKAMIKWQWLRQKRDKESVEVLEQQQL